MSMLAALTSPDEMGTVAGWPSMVSPSKDLASIRGVRVRAANTRMKRLIRMILQVVILVSSLCTQRRRAD